MGILNFLNPVSVFNSARSIIKDLSNYLFYRKQIKKMVSQNLFSDLKARTDLLKRVYYVLNLEPETLLATGDLADLEKSRVFESVSKIQGRLADYNLVEIINVSSTRIKTTEYYAFLILIKYDSQFKFSNLLKVLVWAVLIYFGIEYGIYLYHNFDIVQNSALQILNRK
jgi:hypothetical protein